MEYILDVFTSDLARKIAKINSIVLRANIGGFDIIFGCSLLKAAFPSINWEKNYWTHYKNHNISFTANIALLNPEEFEAECLTRGACASFLAISDIINSGILKPPFMIPSKYRDLTEVFFKDAANTLHEHGPQDLTLETSCELPFRLLYNLSQVELEVLWEYISDNLAKRFIQPFT